MTDNGPNLSRIEVKRADRVVDLAFSDGAEFTLTNELLRVESPSAEVQGHNPSQKVTVAGKRNVAISRVEPVGNYAVRIVFDDGHSTGLYSWPYLYEMGQNQESLWQNYLSALEEQRLSRD